MHFQETRTSRKAGHERLRIGALLAEDRSEAAFAELVKRYIDFVYFAAFRVHFSIQHLALSISPGVYG
jgi:hypothetical protein